MNAPVGRRGRRRPGRSGDPVVRLLARYVVLLFLIGSAAVGLGFWSAR